jgi:hypothetical protein
MQIPIASFIEVPLQYRFSQSFCCWKKDYRYGGVIPSRNNTILKLRYVNKSIWYIEQIHMSRFSSLDLETLINNGFFKENFFAGCFYGELKSIWIADDENGVHRCAKEFNRYD